MLNIIFKNRRIRKYLYQHNPSKTISQIISISFTIIFSCFLISLYFIYQSVIQDIPSISELPNYFEPPNGILFHPTKIFDRSGKHVIFSFANPNINDIQYFQLTKGNNTIPKWVITAIVQEIDEDYWTHPGYRLDLFSFAKNQHPKTIQERIIDNYLMWGKPPSLKKSIQRIILSNQITTTYGRDRILEWYINNSYFGRLAVGIDAAAKVYFNKRAYQLDLAESAQLATLIEAPTINPIDQPLQAKRRKEQTLGLLAKKNKITEEQYIEAINKLLIINPKQFTLNQNNTSIFITYTIKQLAALFGWERLEQGGLDIVSTLDYDLQYQADCIIQFYQEKQLGSTPTSDVDPVSLCQSARYLSFENQNNNHLADVNINIIMMDVPTSQVLALSSTTSTEINNALGSGRPAGTLLSPFIYLSGLSSGFTASSMLWNENTHSDISLLKENPNNPSHQQFPYPIRLRTALANDFLPPINQILSNVGAESVVNLLRQMGVSTQTTHDQSSSNKPLLEANYQLIELAHTFNTLANNGTMSGRRMGNVEDSDTKSVYQQLLPSFLLKVSDQKATTLLDWITPQTKPIINEQLSYLINHILSDETARWQTLGHPNPLEINRPAAVKIGRTYDKKDNWTIGYTPSLLSGVWVGASQENELIADTSAAQFWASLMKYAHRGKRIENWSVPDEIITKEVCDPSGGLPTKDCPIVIKEIFIKNTEPNHWDTFYSSITLNKENGKLATILTPIDSLEKKIITVFPTTNTNYSTNELIQIIPREYDTIYIKPSKEQQIKITSPLPFSYQKGLIDINGTIEKEEIEYYRILVGKGLFPKNWLEIHHSDSPPRYPSPLTQWDTKNNNGVYNIQLQVVEPQSKLATDNIYITVDNRPPIIKPVYPSKNQKISLQNNKQITLTVDVKDDIKIELVRIKLDDKELTHLTVPPYTTSWTASIGEHTLEIIATDKATNQTEEQIKFSVTP